ncbi:MAG: carbohydrate ABC transporter permease [Clostridiales bacterium]|nr:carbohydrate ABC transporter permease [Clostridiales bacterium]
MAKEPKLTVVKKSDKPFMIGLYIVMALIMMLTFYPMWYSVINSLNSAADLSKNGYAYLLPRDFTLDSWKAVVRDPVIVRAFLTTVSRTVLVTFFQTLITAMFAYGFSRTYLRGKKLYSVVGFMSMYLNGGVIAYFILYNTIGLYNSFWVYIIPALFGGFYNVIIFNANYKSIPDSLFESAKIDGASEYRMFFQIVLPLSKPVLSALAIFTAVGTWNDYSATLYYTRSPALQTLSYYLLSITKSSKAAEELQKAMSVGVAANLANVVSQSSNYRTIELACMVMAALPLIIVYPFLQKFFEKGMMVGSVKG